MWWTDKETVRGQGHVFLVCCKAKATCFLLNYMAKVTCFFCTTWPKPCVSCWTPRPHATLFLLCYMAMATCFLLYSSVSRQLSMNLKYCSFYSVLRIRIRIRSVFRSFLDPDSYSEYGSGSTHANKGSVAEPVLFWPAPAPGPFFHRLRLLFK